MKWCFLVNDAPFIIEFLGKLSHETLKEGDECIILVNNKMSELTSKKIFPENIKLFSKIDWIKENYRENQERPKGICWKDFFATFDRKGEYFKFDYKNSTEIISQLYRFIDFVFQNEKPDIVINEPPANLFTEIAYRLCEKYKIAYIGLISSRFEGRIDVYDSEFTCTNYKKDFEKINDKDISGEEKKFAENFMEKFVSHKQLPSYMKYHLSPNNEAKRLLRYLKEQKTMFRYFFGYFLMRKKIKMIDYESETRFKLNFKRPIYALRRRMRKILLPKIFSDINENDNFYLFPLHVQPEASTSVQATYFCDQVNTIKNIAFALPFPFKLYVKEHPAFVVGGRPADFYSKIKKIPNAVLVSPCENVENLVKKSKGVITLTSTIGMEAALIGKPVYVFGNVFYSYHPYCNKVSGFEELKEKINNDLGKKNRGNDLRDINFRFIISYFRNTVKGEIGVAINPNDSNNYKEIYKFIRQRAKV